jgi:transposase
VCSGCGRKLEEGHDAGEREIRDLPCMEFRAMVVIEVYRVCCADCGMKVEMLRRYLSFPGKLLSASASRTQSVWPMAAPRNPPD